MKANKIEALLNQNYPTGKNDDRKALRWQSWLRQVSALSKASDYFTDQQL